MVMGDDYFDGDAAAADDDDDDQGGCRFGATCSRSSLPTWTVIIVTVDVFVPTPLVREEELVSQRTTEL